MSKHTSPTTVYNKFVCYRNFIETCILHGLVTKEKGQQRINEEMDRCVRKVGENKFTDMEYGYMGRSL